MKRIARLALALALALAAAPATAQVTTAVVHRVERAERGDTTSLTFHVRGPTTALLSEPFVLADRTRLYLDVDGVTAAPDSAALARLAGDNIVALAPRIRTGGTAVAIDVRALAGYTIAQDDSTITVRIAKAHQAAAEAAHVPAAQPPAATAAPKPWTLERLRQLPLPAGKALLALALALLLLLAGARAWAQRTPVARAAPRPTPRRPAPSPAAAAPVTPPAPASPAVSISPDGRIWAARALDAAGASITEIARRTGLAREAVQFLRATRTPAESAASGRNFRAEAAGPADPSPRPRVKAVV